MTMTANSNRSTKVTPEMINAQESRDEELERLRSARLLVSEYDIDDITDDECSVSSEEQRNVILQDIHFKRGECETIRKVLKETELIALKRSSEGFNEVNFSLGVLNCFLICYMIGAHPEHLWLLYVIESLYMIPRKFYNMWHAKPLNQALYYLDFCWCMNFLGISVLLVLGFSEVLGINIENDIRETVFKACIGVSCGILLGANIALPFVACLFHDVNTMTGFFIHFVPPLVMYTFMWHTDEIISAWPKTFNFSYFDGIKYFGGMDSVAGCATTLYFMWWTFYVSFILLGGLNLPRKLTSNGQKANPKWDTVFHSTLRGGPYITMGKIFRGRSKVECLQQMEDNNYDLIDFFIYMGFHMAGGLGAIYLFGYGCFKYQYFHLAMLAICAVLAVVRGANRYTYYSTKMYSRTLKKQFAHIINDDSGQGDYSRMK